MEETTKSIKVGSFKSLSTDKRGSFRIRRVKAITDMYADEIGRVRRNDETPKYSSTSFTSASDVRKIIKDALQNNNSLIESSKQLYVTNPIYASLIDYLSNMFIWRYKVTPHKIYSENAKASGDYAQIYNLMLEIVDGLNIETFFPELLTKLFVEGEIYLATQGNEEEQAIDTIILPRKYCRRIGNTQFRTPIIEFDYTYFTDLGYNKEALEEFLLTMPQEIQTQYQAYVSDNSLRWQMLNPLFNSCVSVNEMGLPSLFYTAGSIMDFEQYNDNELARNKNKLRYLVTQKIPIFQDQLILEPEEVADLHKSIKKIIDKNGYANLITSYGDIDIKQIGSSDVAENEVLKSAYRAIYNNAGFNDGLFTQSSVTALEMALCKDTNMVWRYVQLLINFYKVAINNWFDFQGYEADVDILRLSSYTYDDDIKTFKDNATLGVAKIDYIIASGIKQRNISDTFELEKYLDLNNNITPFQTSFTQTAEDRKNEDGDADAKGSGDKKSSSSDIEPSEGKGNSSTETTSKTEKTTEDS